MKKKPKLPTFEGDFGQGVNSQKWSLQIITFLNEFVFNSFHTFGGGQEFHKVEFWPSKFFLKDILICLGNFENFIFDFLDDPQNDLYLTEFHDFVGQNHEKIQKPKKLAYTRYNIPNRIPDHETTISNPHHSEV